MASRVYWMAVRVYYFLRYAWRPCDAPPGVKFPHIDIPTAWGVAGIIAECRRADIYLAESTRPRKRWFR